MHVGNRTRELSRFSSIPFLAVCTPHYPSSNSPCANLLHSCIRRKRAQCDVMTIFKDRNQKVLKPITVAWAFTPLFIFLPCTALKRRKMKEKRGRGTFIVPEAERGGLIIYLSWSHCIPCHSLPWNLMERTRARKLMRFTRIQKPSTYPMFP